jgi:hypothetical protein
MYLRQCLVCCLPALQAREISESPASSSQPQQQPEPPAEPAQQQQQPQQQHISDPPDSPDMPPQQQQQQQPAKPDPQKASAAVTPDGHPPEGSSTGLHFTAANRKLLWLGIAVGFVLVVAIVQLAFATLWQPAAGSSKGASNGGLIKRALGAGGRPYQQVGTSDDQELAELSERGLLMQDSSSTAHNPPLAAQAHGGQQPQ